jgi:hypothetical protein
MASLSNFKPAVADPPHVGELLVALQRDFPSHRIWVEDGRGRVRYVARGLRLEVRPYAVVTSDLEELRGLLAVRSNSPVGLVAYNPAVPSIARMYNYWTGGKDHHQADRQAADSVLADFPEVATIARANRDFVTRAVAWVAARGISQFLDIGAGLPAEPAVHQTAQRMNPPCGPSMWTTTAWSSPTPVRCSLVQVSRSSLVICEILPASWPIPLRLVLLILASRCACCSPPSCTSCPRTRLTLLSPPSQGQVVKAMTSSTTAAQASTTAPNTSPVIPPSRRRARRRSRSPAPSPASTATTPRTAG